MLKKVLVVALLSMVLTAPVFGLIGDECEECYVIAVPEPGGGDFRASVCLDLAPGGYAKCQDSDYLLMCLLWFYCPIW